MTNVTPSLPFRRRVIDAGLWSIGGFGLSQVLRLCSNLIMTRLLVPEMFGVMAIANVLILGLHMFSDMGLRQSVVQSARGNVSAFLNTVWVVQILRGGLICILALSCGGLLLLINRLGWLPNGSAYDNGVLPYVIFILSIGPLLSGFESTKLALSNRNLALGRFTVVEIVSQILGIMAMIAWAFLDRSIWALVSGSLMATLARTIMSHAILPGTPNRWEWDQSAFREIFSFGKWIFLSSILGFLLNSGDRLLLGGLVNTEQLGVYSIAFFLINSVSLALSKLFTNTAFPALSEIARDRPQKLQATYYKLRVPIDVATLFASGFFFTAGHVVINLLYDDRYIAAGPMAEILAVSLFWIRFGVAEQNYLALGKPAVLSSLITIRLVALYALVPLAFHYYGFEGALWAISMNYLFSMPLTFYFKYKYGFLDPIKELLVLPVFLLGVLVGQSLIYLLVP